MDFKAQSNGVTNCIYISFPLKMDFSKKNNNNKNKPLTKLVNKVEVNKTNLVT